MNRNIQAIEHKGVIYVRLDDLQSYIGSLADRVAHPAAKNALDAILYKFEEVRGGRPTAPV